MKWVKKGQIYIPNQKYNWNYSHAQVPVVEMINESIWRIYYSSRSIENKSTISYIEVEAGNPQNIIYEHHEPILPFGKLGTFDDSGLMPSSIVNYNNKKYLYYIGWTTRGTVPYHNSIGLAISHDGGKSFEKAFEGPVISVTHKEPYFTGTCYVMLENNIWKAWYLSCTKWELIQEKAEPFYHIKYAESLDGITWKREGVVAIDYNALSEGGIVSASVIKDGEIYKMWYGYRMAENYRTDLNQSYRIGYAESEDALIWQRKDNKAGINISEEGWDSGMISYPNVIVYQNKKYMFYNGNGFGKTGFGYAIMENNNQ